MHVLGIIPARGGSKAIPGKNLVPLAGRPLLAYTCQAAKCSKRLTRTIISTDDVRIAEAAGTWDIEVPFFRPSALAQDDTPMLDVLSHALTWLVEKESYYPAIVVLLQPTSPLRRSEHIDAAVALLLESGADSVVSVIEVPHQFNPASLMRIEAGRLRPLGTGTTVSRRQDKAPVYARNGPSVLATRSHVILEQRSLYGQKCVPLEMTLEESVDIDEPRDLLLAEYLLTRHSPRGKHEVSLQDSGAEQA